MSTQTGPVAAAEEKRSATTGPERASIDPHQGRRAWLLISPTIAVLLVVIGYPIVRAVYMSFQKDAALDPSTGLFVQGGFAGLLNYKHWILQQCGDAACGPGTNASNFWGSVWITVFFTIVTVLLELVLGFMFAMIMNGNF